MDIISISKLNSYNYSVNILNSIDYRRNSSEIFSCNKIPKIVNNLTYYKNCSGLYTLKDGTTLNVQSDDIVYTPECSEYSISFRAENAHSSTVGFNFLLYNKKFEPFVLSNDIIVFKNHDMQLKQLFSALDNCINLNTPNLCMAKSYFYEIMSLLCENYQRKHFGKFDSIAKGILYLEKCNTSNILISDLADMCKISESYFRRLFKEYSGMTPLEYILYNKIKKAKIYLKYENLSINEIAELLGFSDASYFTKKFKETIGMTPSEYRKL